MDGRMGLKTFSELFGSLDPDMLDASTLAICSSMIIHMTVNLEMPPELVTGSLIHIVQNSQTPDLQATGVALNKTMREDGVPHAFLCLISAIGASLAANGHDSETMTESERSMFIALGQGLMKIVTPDKETSYGPAR